MDLRLAAHTAPAHGLALQEQALAELSRLERLSTRDGEAARRLDATADGLFQSLALQFSQGGADPIVADPDWRIARAAPADVRTLREAVAAGAGPAATLQALLPQSAEYRALVDALARARGDGAGVAQETHIERLRANLERWRWLPRRFPDNRIEVRVPFFELRLHGANAAPVTHAVIVGARRTPTPTFAGEIETVTLNPSWTPPSSIVNDELLPRFRRDSGAAAAEGFEVLDAYGRVVDLATVNWRARPFPYTLRQRPGAGNALGRVRFDFPNPFSVFLHDTPSRSLFARTDRALSHGCIRVADPVALAADVLGDAAWDETALGAAIEQGRTQVLPVAPRLPIYVLYLTVASDGAGVVSYAEDVYRRDAALVRALDAPAPARSLAAVAAGGICASVAH